MTIGEKIAFYRKKENITQENLAQQLGVTNQAVSKWESDQCCPDIMLLPKLADIFGISIDTLFGRETKAVPAGLPWPDDNILRLAVYVGHSMKCGGLANGDYRVDMPVDGVLSCVSVACGDVQGDVNSGGDVTCDKVEGDVNAGGDVTCDDVEGNVNAGGDITCDCVEGSVAAGGDISCDEITGSVTAGGDVNCDHFEGTVYSCGGGIHTEDSGGEKKKGFFFHL